MKRLLLIATLLCLAPLPVFAAEPNDCSSDVLPDGSKNCRYRHVEYDSFSYSGGELSVRWPKNYEVEDILLSKNWKKMFAYEPGSSVQVELSPMARYDLVARFTDKQTGETFLGITPVSCVSRISGHQAVTLTPAPTGGCIGDTGPRSCTVKTDVPCTDDQGSPAGTVAAECSGDTGTCSDSCSDSETACCTASRTTTTTSGNGTNSSSTTIEENEQPCE